MRVWLKAHIITNEIMSYGILNDHEPCVPDKCTLNEFPDVYFLYSLIFYYYLILAMLIA